MATGVYDHTNRRKQFCVKNHDTFIYGRTKSGNCKECKRIKSKKEPKPKNSMCPHGHDTAIVGRTKDSYCKECRRNHDKKYRELNKEKIKIKQKKKFAEYYNKNRDKILKQKKEYENKNKEKIKVKRHIYYLSNKERFINYKREHKEEIQKYRKQWYEENKEYFKQWKINHPDSIEKCRIAQDIKRSLRVVVWTDWAVIGKIYKKRPKGMEVDHYIPLLGNEVSGLHVSWNLQYLTIKDNRVKFNNCNLLVVSEWYGKILEQAGLK